MICSSSSRFFRSVSYEMKYPFNIDENGWNSEAMICLQQEKNVNNINVKLSWKKIINLFSYLSVFLNKNCVWIF